MAFRTERTFLTKTVGNTSLVTLGGGATPEAEYTPAVVDLIVSLVPPPTVPNPLPAGFDVPTPVIPGQTPLPLASGFIEIEALNLNLIGTGTSGAQFIVAIIAGMPANLTGLTLTQQRTAGRVVWETMVPTGTVMEKIFPKVCINYIAGVQEQVRLKFYMAGAQETGNISRMMSYIESKYTTVQF